MNLQNLKKLYAANGCDKIYIKKLAPNDNSKNQVYLGGSFEVLNVFPVSEIKTEEAGEWSKERFKAALRFSWIDVNGNLSPAPNAQLILYPKYPEVRFSGFLSGCESPPSELMNSRIPGRILFLGVSQFGDVLGYVVSPDSEFSSMLQSEELGEDVGVFKVLEIRRKQSNKEILLAELSRIHKKSWIQSKRLDKNGLVVPCNATNCGGYTLEAELGIIPNGYSEPDYLGWEIKQFGVTDFHKLKSSVITLMTPEPTQGFYKSNGAQEFLLKYGYPDKKGKEDRLNFGGIYKVGMMNKLTGLSLHLIGFDVESCKIRNVTGSISLIDLSGNVAAEWSFSSMLQHWNRKHNQACYVPSLSDKVGHLKYKYGNSVLLGQGTDFQLFLSQMAVGNVYYDPGIKMENYSTKPKVKKRSQFRIISKNLEKLYSKLEEVNLMFD